MFKVASKVRVAIAAAWLLAGSQAIANDLPAPTPHLPTFTDAAKVDIESRSSQIILTDVTIGSGDLALRRQIHSVASRFTPYGFADNFSGGLSLSVGASASNSGCPYLVGTAEQNDCFTLSGTTYTARKADGATLVDTGGGILIYTNHDGDRFTINTNYGSQSPNASQGVITKIERANGVEYDLYWDVHGTAPPIDARLISVYANTGFALKYEYATDSYTFTTPITQWNTPAKVTAFNRTIINCAITALHCTFTGSWPASVFTWVSKGDYVGYTLTIKNPDNNRSIYQLDPVFRVISYTPVNATSPEYTYTYCRAMAIGVPTTDQHYYGDPCTIIRSDGSVDVVYDGVKWATKEGRQWNYNPQLSFGGCGCYYSNASSDPDSRLSQITTFTNAAEPEVINFSDTVNGVFGFKQDATNALLSWGQPDEAQWTYTYDARGNVTEARQVAAVGSGATDIVQSAVYPSTCANAKTCNRPTSITDANSHSETFTYEPNSGQILTKTLPAVGGINPQTRYGYTQRFATFIDDTGTASQAPTGVWLLTSESQCISSAWTGSACSAGSGDEVVTQYDYGPSTGLNNLLLRGVAITNGATTRRTCYSYDSRGNKISETKPNASLSSCS